MADVARRRTFSNIRSDALDEELIFEVEKNIENLKERKFELELQLEDLEKLLQMRKQPLEASIGDTVHQRLEASIKLEMLQQAEARAALPGPAALRWAAGATYAGLCTFVICVNVAVMSFQFLNYGEEYKSLFWNLDQVFLVWYISEITVKALLYHHLLLCGRLSEVTWNWLDLVLVLIGIVDQWIAPAIRMEVSHIDNHSGFNFSHLRALRLLRLLRLIRILKVAKAFNSMDMSFAEGMRFQTFMMCCIALNSVLMGVELDMPWKGWYWVEQILLIIYVFELVARVQYRGKSFFTMPGEAAWNWTDFAIVIGGVIESWVLPSFYLIMSHVPTFHLNRGRNGGGLISLLRVCRLARIMRLVRLLRSIQPLFLLMSGILRAMQGMQWVIILTIVVLYACAILVTSLVGHGIIYGEDEVPEEAQQIFGDIPTSFLNLFKIMNDDQSVVAPLLQSAFVQGFFVFFMVISNWSMLAILTSVVSDNMIAATMADEKMRDETRRKDAAKTRAAILHKLFLSADHDESGTVDEMEFKHLLNNDSLREQMLQVTGLSAQSLIDMFTLLSSEDEDGRRVLDYEDFIEKLNTEKQSATERTVYRIEERLRAHEKRTLTRFDSVLQLLGKSAGERKMLLRASRAQDVSKEKKRMQCLTRLTM